MDIEQIKSLTQLMVDGGLSEVIIREGDDRIILRRGVASAGQWVPAAPLAHPTPQVAAAPAAAPPLPAGQADEAEDAKIRYIKSPIVGTFYAGPKPGEPAFVKVGDTVGKDTVVCIIEAMKVFNEIKAEFEGKIMAIEVRDGEPVEYGKVLMKVRVP